MPLKSSRLRRRRPVRAVNRSRRRGFIVVTVCARTRARRFGHSASARARRAVRPSRAPLVVAPRDGCRARRARRDRRAVTRARGMDSPARDARRRDDAARDDDDDERDDERRARRRRATPYRRPYVAPWIANTPATSPATRRSPRARSSAVADGRDEGARRSGRTRDADANRDGARAGERRSPRRCATRTRWRSRRARRWALGDPVETRRRRRARGRSAGWEGETTEDAGEARGDARGGGGDETREGDQDAVSRGLVGRGRDEMGRARWRSAWSGGARRRLSRTRGEGRIARTRCARGRRRANARDAARRR